MSQQTVACRISVHTAPDQRQGDERLEHGDDQQTARWMWAARQLYRAIHPLSPAIYYIVWWLTCWHVSYWRRRRPVSCRRSSAEVIHLIINVRLCSISSYNTLKLQFNGPSYSSAMIGTLAVGGWAVTFGTARRGLGGLRPRPVPSSLYQM